MYHRGADSDPILCESGVMINSAGWGFVNWLDEYLLPLLDNGYHLTDILAVWDGGNAYRTTLFSGYKQKRQEQREKEPSELRHELKRMEESAKAFLANLGAINVYAPGVEADDVIAALCEGFKDIPKVIHTVDADLLQLSDPCTHVYLRNKPIFEEHEGVPLHLIRLNKALVGDKSDGYIGVSRFGEKAWEKLQAEIGVDGLEEIDRCFAEEDFKALKEAAPLSKLITHIVDNLKDARRCYKLATLHPELCHQFCGNQLIWPLYYTRVPDRARVENILLQMGCIDYLDKIDSMDVFPRQTLVNEHNFEILFRDYREQLENTPFVSFDYETYDVLNHPQFQEAMPKQSGEYVDVLSQQITGMSVNYGSDFQYTLYIPIEHEDTFNFEPETLASFLKLAVEMGKPLVAHNASFEELVTRLNLDYALIKPLDTIIMSSYVNENEDSHSLKHLSAVRLNYQQATYKETLEAAGAKNMAELTGKQVLSYGCDDAMVTAHLCRLFHTIMKMEKTWDFYMANELAPVHVLTDAFETGVRLDFEKISELHEKANHIIDTGIDRIREILEERCKEPLSHVAENYDEADGDNLINIDRYNDLNKDKQGTDDHYLAKRQERLLKWEEATVYRPYTETYTPPTFLGTHTQLNIVAEQLGVDLAEHFLPSIANVRINEWMTGLMNAKEHQPMSKELARFLTHVAECTGPPLKKRQGIEFEALKEFCIPYLGEGKLEKEGDELNFNSPKQMQELLYLKLGLPVRRRTRPQRGSTRSDLALEGSPATDEEAMLLAIAEDCTGEFREWKKEVLQLVIDIKEQQTMVSIYYKPYPLWVHPRDNMVHPTIKNCGTVTRRPSSNNPNILQVKKGETRSIYLPRYNDHVIVAIDFSGQELRITGSESMDPVLIDAYTGGGLVEDEDGMIHPVTKDIHSVTAISFAETIFQRELESTDFEFTYDRFREMLKSDDEKVAKAAALCRKMAKVVNFLIIYMGQPSTLAMRLGVPERFAEELMRQVFINYVRLEPWQEETVLFARQHGYVRTAYGTIKHLTDEIRSRDGGLRSRQERQAVNQTIQGCAADILKVVLTASYDTNIWKETGSHLIAPVYDEIVATVPKINCFEYCQRMQDLMNVTPPGHVIPMMAEVSIGPDWGSVVELGDRPSERKLIDCMEGM